MIVTLNYPISRLHVGGCCCVGSVAVVTQGKSHGITVFFYLFYLFIPGFDCLKVRLNIRDKYWMKCQVS